eukprot:s123_g1.t1
MPQAEATGVEDILIANDKAPEEFEPVPFKVVDRAWAVTGRHQWRRPLTLPVAEARASLNAVKHVIRTQANWGMKHLLLSDSMTAVCALSRGRAQGFELRRVCQQFGAIPLVTRCSFSLRWIPSEWNPADGPSRGSWTASQPKQIGPPKLERATPLFSSLEVGGRLSGSGGTEHGDLPEPFAAQFESSQESLEAAGTGGGETKTTHSQSYGRGGKRLHQPDSAEGSSANRTLTAQCPNKTVLEAAAVTPACLRRYQVAPIAEVDSNLANHLEFLFLEGEDLSAAQYLIAAIIFFVPAIKAMGIQSLPRVKQSLQGWRRLCPPQSRLPVPFEVVALVFLWAVESNRVQLGFHLLLSFMLYLRPGEALGLRIKDVASKTQEFDETVGLDLPYHAGVGAALHRALQLQRRHEDQKVFTHTLQDFAEFTEAAANALSLQKLGPFHPYRLRHGGASHDFVNKLRDLTEIQHRGRWKSTASVRRYQKGGRLTQLMNALPKQVQQHAIKAASKLQDTLRKLR